MQEKACNKGVNMCMLKDMSDCKANIMQIRIEYGATTVEVG